LHILSSLKASAIVYVRKRAGAEELARFLKAKGIEADFYHAGLTSFQREQKQEAWKKGEVPVIVATNAFGMGIDKPIFRIVPRPISRKPGEQDGTVRRLMRYCYTTKLL